MCQNDNAIDPLFTKVLRFPWMEESQHARIDALELAKLLASATPEMINKAFDDYPGLIDAFDGLLKAQAEMDGRAIVRATGRVSSSRWTSDQDPSHLARSDRARGGRLKR